MLGNRISVPKTDAEAEQEAAHLEQQAFEVKGSVHAQAYLAHVDMAVGTVLQRLRNLPQ